MGLKQATNEGGTMPHILVVTDHQDDPETSVVYRERLSPSDFESEHFSDQLVERVGWAVLDAIELDDRPSSEEER